MIRGRTLRAQAVPVVFSVLVVASAAGAQAQPGSSQPRAILAELVKSFRDKARSLEGSSGMRSGFARLTTGFGIPKEMVRYSDFVIVRLLFEATRDAGLWNLHWAITDRPPNSDNVWRQWQSARQPAYAVPTATAECDELSALFAFLARSLGIKGVGLLWPTGNHTVAVWELHPTSGPAVRVVVPTTQIFLGEDDLFATRRFDPWRQRLIYEYTRRDAPQLVELPPALLTFFLAQAERYGGATDVTLQRLRYLREGVFLKRISREQAALDALSRSRAALASGVPEDIAAFAAFAQDMRTGVGFRPAR